MTEYRSVEPVIPDFRKTTGVDFGLPLVSCQLAVNGRIWSILVAGTTGYDDYAMQADICHAYQILFRGEINMEDMIVFMADDIAFHPRNVEPGIIRHELGGPNVYLGVQKNYSGEHLTLKNFEAVLLGEKSLLVGGSGRVLLTNPQDRVFFYFSSHGKKDAIQFGRERLSSDHLLQMLVHNYLHQKYKSMVIYASACHGGSMFLDYDSVYNDMNIYVMSAASHDLLAWKVSDSDFHKTSLGVQFGVVWTKDSCCFNDELWCYLVAAYDDARVLLSITCVSNPLPRANDSRWEPLETTAYQIHIEDGFMIRVAEGYRYDLWNRYKGSSRSERLEIVNEMSESLKEIAIWDRRLDMIGFILFGPEKGRAFLRVKYEERPELMDVLDYLECSRSVDALFEKHCGLPSFKGLRHVSSRSNLCHLATKEAIEEAIILSCGMNIIEPEPQQQVPHGFIAFGTASEDIMNQDADDNEIAQLRNWTMQIVVATTTFLNYVGSPRATVAAVSCFTLHYVIYYIITSRSACRVPQLFMRRRKLPWEKCEDGWTIDQVSMWVSFPRFKEWMLKNHKRIHVSG
ncbi:vacuolar-processing enzyme-like [Bidens hawaiensis]|uniref:vacuolar-processing enzyme-like n=1 Tax=Bidens hawaiensis TaxID=980011 RepID=UPI00404B6F3E